MHRWSYDAFGDLANRVMDDSSGKEAEDAGSRFLQCPRLTLFMLNVPVLSLIDTGSQITCISEKNYEYLKLHGKMNEFPVSNMFLSTAIGKKTTTIKKTNLSRCIHR